MLNAADVRAWTPAQKLAWLQSLDDDDAALLLRHWDFWARDNQRLPPGDWTTFLVLAGRGFGKTRIGTETICQWAMSGEYRRMALIGATAADVRDVMVGGESGLLNCYDPAMRPVYEPSKRRVTWPNGAIATCYSAEEPERLRGPQHDGGWADELAAWRYPTAWDQYQFGLRLGQRPRTIVTTTPKPLQILRTLLKDPFCITRRGSTYDNLQNLAPVFRRTILSKYEGTRLGRQELDAEMLDDVPGALLERRIFDAAPVLDPPPMLKIVVGVDPAVTSGETSDHTGIVAAGLGEDRDAYVIEDATCHAKPHEWAERVVDLALEVEADAIIGEVNNGGDLIEALIDTVWAKKERLARESNTPPPMRIPYKAVRASRGKRTRAEPIAGLYQQGRIRHCRRMPHLEDQWCTWDPLTASESPDRVDACVYAITDLMPGMTRAAQAFVDLSRQPERRPKGPLA